MTDAVISYIVTAMKKVWCWVLGLAADALQAAWYVLKPYMPDMASTGGEPTGGLSEILPLVNCWLPLDQAAWFLSAWITFRVGLIIYRFGKSWIPIGS